MMSNRRNKTNFIVRIRKVLALLRTFPLVTTPLKMRMTTIKKKKKDENDTYAFTRMKEFVQINFEVTYNFQLSTLPRLPRC